MGDGDWPGRCNTGSRDSDMRDAEVGAVKHPLHAAALKVAKTGKPPANVAETFMSKQCCCSTRIACVA